jgi:hypothetical protein
MTILRVRVVTDGWSGGPGLNTFYFNGMNTLGHAEDVVTRVQAAMDLAKNIYPSNITIQVQPTVDQLDEANGDMTGTWATPPQDQLLGSQGANDIAPPATAMLLQYQTGTYSDGSRLRGHAFFSPVAGLFASPDGTPDGTALTSLRAAGAALLDSGLAPSDLCVWRRPRAAYTYKGKSHPDRVGSTGAVTSTSVPDRFAVLKSRRP